MLAIDFGTSQLRAAAIDAKDGSRELDVRRLDAVVALSSGAGAPVIGSEVARLAGQSPDELAVAVRRLLGRDYDEPYVRGLARRLSARLAQGVGGEVAYSFQGQRISPTVAAARLLRLVAKDFDESSCVAAVPSCFDVRSRMALSQSFQCAGLRLERLYPESIAATLGAELGDGRFLVCDVGAGFTEFAVVERRGRVVGVLGAAADMGWGGDDVDSVLVHEIVEALPKGDRDLLIGDRAAMVRLRAEVQQLKQRVGSSEVVTLHLPELFEGENDTAVDVSYELTADRLEASIDTTLRRLELPFHDAMAGADVTMEDLDGVVVTGGAAKLAAITKRIERLAGRQVRHCADEEGAVLLGLVELGRAWQRKEPFVVIERMASTLGLAEGEFFAPVISRGARLPIRVEKILTTRTDNQKEILFSLYHGESSNVGHSRLVGQYICDQLIARPAGDSSTIVEITINENGVLLLDARDMIGGAPLSVRRVSGPGLTRPELAAAADTVSSL